MIESGYPDFVVRAFFGLVAPAGTPAAIVDEAQRRNRRRTLLAGDAEDLRQRRRRSRARLTGGFRRCDRRRAGEVGHGRQGRRRDAGISARDSVLRRWTTRHARIAVQPDGHHPGEAIMTKQARRFLRPVGIWPVVRDRARRAPRRSRSWHRARSRPCWPRPARNSSGHRPQDQRERRSRRGGDAPRQFRRGLRHCGGDAQIRSRRWSRTGKLDRRHPHRSHQAGIGVEVKKGAPKPDISYGGRLQARDAQCQDRSAISRSERVARWPRAALAKIGLTDTGKGQAHPAGGRRGVGDGRRRQDRNRHGQHFADPDHAAASNWSARCRRNCRPTSCSPAR